MKKSNFLLTVTTCITAFIFICGCHKKTENDVGIVKSCYGTRKARMDGICWFSSEDIANDTAKAKLSKAGFSGGFYNKKNSTVIPGGAVFINSRPFWYNQSIRNDSLFGTNVTFTIYPPANTAPAPVTYTLYSPTAIQITSAPKPKPFLGYKHYINQHLPFTITWNADTKNTNGVEIYAKYLPMENDSLAKAGYKNVIESALMVNDNGLAVLPAGFFAKFPAGALIWLLAGRGNAVVVQSGGYFYNVGGLTEAVEFAHIVK